MAIYLELEKAIERTWIYIMRKDGLENVILTGTGHIDVKRDRLTFVTNMMGKTNKCHYEL